MTQQTQQHSTWLAAHEAGWTADDIWLHYFSVGGNLKVFELDAYLHGMYPLPVGERNIIAFALNELSMIYLNAEKRNSWTNRCRISALPSTQSARRKRVDQLLYAHLR